jgi:hypothetical protein
MFALALFALSVACLLTAPIAIAVALAVVVWGSIADVEVAVVVSRRRPDGARGQRVIASARTTPRKAIGAAAGWGVSTARAAADIGPAFGVLCAVWALPWIALAAPDGAAAAAGVCGLLAIARWGAGAGGLRFRADV